MEDRVKIREVGESDVNNIVALHRKVVSQENGKYYSKETINEWLSQISSESVSQQLSIKDTPWYLIEDNQRIIGFCQFSIEDETLYQINIDPDFKGKGYGKKLYAFIENIFKSAGVKRIELWSTINAKEFYEKLGFVAVKKIKTKLINTEMDEYFMEKIL